ncbi:hypothetical protein OAO87_03110 [bacterium]|nr:hypothetical protein [bacterium]
MQLPGVARQQREKTTAIMSPQELSMLGGEAELAQLLKDREAARAVHKAATAAWVAAAAEEAAREAAYERALKTYESVRERYLPLDPVLERYWARVEKAADAERAASAAARGAVEERISAEAAEAAADWRHRKVVIDAVLRASEEQLAARYAFDLWQRATPCVIEFDDEREEIRDRAEELFYVLIRDPMQHNAPEFVAAAAGPSAAQLAAFEACHAACL